MKAFKRYVVLFFALFISACGSSPDAFKKKVSDTEDGTNKEEPQTVNKTKLFAVDLAQPVAQLFLDAAKDKGVTTIVRYYDYENETLKGKLLRQHELKLIRENDLHLAVVFQHHNNKLSSFTSLRGQKDSLRCLDLAKKFNQPLDSAIYFGVDGGWGKSKKEEQQILDYFIEASPRVRDAGYRVGVYGSGLVCRILRARGLVDYCWLANAKSWPEYQKLKAAKTWSMAQRLPEMFAGISVDFNEIPEDEDDHGQFTVPPSNE